MPSRSGPTRATRPLRADALRSIERILDAAVEELSLDPDAGMAAIAQRAGVVRATLYVHFPTREALIGAVGDLAIAEAADAIRGANPDEGDPREAVARVLHAAWRTVGRYHALVTLATREGRGSDHRFHGPVLQQIAPLLRRGQASGAFNPDVPTRWLLTLCLELIHAASREVSEGRMSARSAEDALVASLLGALSPRRAHRATTPVNGPSAQGPRRTRRR